ncbi:MAG: hypothetical protein U1E29_00190, partial [Coriobacteriia bacterium]|nr:hypothetical protein [Coriobacteriia bacterium]
MKVLIAYHYFPLYRLPIISALAEHDLVDLHLHWGRNTGSVHIRILEESQMYEAGLPEGNARIGRNIWLGPILWQTGIL